MKETKRLSKKLFPQIKGSVSFGVDDPYLMGQILTVLAFFIRTTDTALSWRQFSMKMCWREMFL